MYKKLPTTNYKLPTNNGYSLVELIVVIAIFLLLMGVGDSVYNNYRTQNSLEVSTNSIVQALRHAQINSEQVKNDSVWGTAIFSDKVVVFQGTNYSGRTISSDQIFNFSSGLGVSGLTEEVFQKTTGWATSIGTTTITNSDGAVKNIYINSKGTIFY